MCGYSITSKPRLYVWPPDDTIAFTWNSPALTLDAGFSMKRTVCDSSERENFTGCSAGVALQPCGSSSFTDVSAGAGRVVEHGDANLALGDRRARRTPTRDGRASGRRP